MVRKLYWIAFLVAGCSTTESSDLTTRGIYASLGARGTGQGTTTVSATLFRDSPATLDFVTLSGDDQLIASHAGEDKPMVESELLNVVSHIATFSADGEGETFEIAFLRSVDSGAPSSTVTLPAGFTLGAVSATSSRAAALSFTWTPSGTADTMSWSARGDCIVDAGGQISGDPGMFSIPANTFAKRDGTGIADSCAVTLLVSRSRPGTLDPGYGKGGTITGAQDRTATFTSMP